MYNWITNSYSSGIQYKSGSWTSGQSIIAHDFQTYTGGWVSRFSIIQNGDVGIGTTSPGSKTEIYRLETTNRTSYTDILTINAAANNSPYSGHGGGILFRGHTYSGSGTNNAPGNVAWGRIGMELNDFYDGFNGENMFFSVAADDRSSTLTRAMTIRYDTNVGIGTSNPTSKLVVSGAATDNLGLVNINNTHSAGDIMYPALQVINDRGNHSYGTVAEFRIANTSDGDRPSILFSKGGTGNNWSLGMGVYAGSHDNFSIGYRSSYYQDAWATSYFTITTSGSIGIGTNSPGYKLDISSGGIRLDAKSALTNNAYFIGAPSHGFRWNSSDDAYNNVIMHDNGNMSVRGAVTAQSINTNTYYSNGGNFLFQYGNTTSGAARSINLSTSTGDPAAIATSNHTGITWGTRGDSEPYYMIYCPYTTYGSYTYNRLTLAWHVGIQIGAASVYGGTRFFNNSINVGTQIFTINDGDNNLRASYDIIAYASDRRLKENVKNIEGALDKVMKINGVHFDWMEKTKDYGFEPDQIHDVGVLAQEIQEVLPEVVTLAPFDYITGGVSKSGENFLTVKYEKLTPLLIEAIKEQQAQIESQKSQNEELIKRIETLESILQNKGI
jgi:hypothetical protein